MSVKARTVAIALGVVFAGLVGCGKTSDDGGADVSHDAGAAVDGAVVEAGEDAPYEMRGVYRCCAEGTGTDCCDGFPKSPSGSNMCFAYGGVYGDCRRAGEELEGKVICAGCCEGLERVDIVVPGDMIPPGEDGLAAGCDLLANVPPSLHVCIRRGDGVCGEGENFCNSPEDCPRP